MGHTAATLNSGTHTPISTAIINRPWVPASRSAIARPMKELKRNATCALAAVAAVLRLGQTGYLYHYAIAMILGVALLLWWFAPLMHATSPLTK